VVVRFPSESESGAGVNSDDATTPDARLAPVTYLPRKSGAAVLGADHPSRGGSSRDSGARGDGPRGGGQRSGGARGDGQWSGDAPRSDASDEPVPVRPVVALPGAQVPEGSDATEEAEDGKQVKRASNVSIHQLARRGMSRWELEQVLAKREIDPAIAQAELNRLESVGLLDDAALAVTLVYTQHTRKGLGRSAISQELHRRHIAPELIEEALAEIADEDELERATELAMKRVGQLSSYDDETAKRRLHGFLARKGYNSSVVRQAMDAALATRGRRGGVRFQ
jgi:regulatory protein